MRGQGSTADMEEWAITYRGARLSLAVRPRRSHECHVVRRKFDEATRQRFHLLCITPSYPLVGVHMDTDLRKSCPFPAAVLSSDREMIVRENGYAINEDRNH